MTPPPRFAPFEWADYFATGFDEVDAQHHKLVDLVNVLAQRAAGGAVIQPAELAHVLDGLANYAVHHFATEENLMADADIDPRHLTAHRHAHADFVAQVAAMRTARDANRVVPALHDFVTSWLTFHILDTDRSMARQLRAIAAGTPPADAFEAEGRCNSDPGNAALIAAVRRLLGLVAERNHELARINAGLEQRVAERTAEATAANRNLRQTQARLQQADKLAAVGQLAAGVAHEINNPLGFVATNLGVLRGYAERLLALVNTADRLAGKHPAWQAAVAEAELDYLRDDLPTLLEESGRGLIRVGDIVHALQDFAEPGPVETIPTRIDALLDDAIAATAATRRPEQTVHRTYATLPLLAINPTLLGEAFKALIDNAARALGEGPGDITVRAACSGHALVVEVEDSGCGMDEATRTRIFEPFFTTRGVGQGRGLGLSFAYRIVSQHRGRIDVDSAPGKGSRFRVVLPLN